MAFEDSRQDTGGFQTVPAFHLHLPEWARQTPRYSVSDFVSCKDDDPLISHALKISVRKGSLLVWSSRYCATFPSTLSSDLFLSLSLSLSLSLLSLSLFSLSLSLLTIRMPHCNYPNDSDRWRYCQYIKMFPIAAMPREGSAAWHARAGAIRHFMPQGAVPSELGERVLGLKPWEKKE